MRLLTACPGSVLWLLGDNPYAILNLRREAAARGVAPERLLFAPHVPNDDHLARHRLADLFLDTLPVNAHATASDALWAGLPVLTCIGKTFAGRVGASLLRAVGMPELVASSLAKYRRWHFRWRAIRRPWLVPEQNREQSKHRAVVRHGTDNAQFGNGLHDNV